MQADLQEDRMAAVESHARGAVTAAVGQLTTQEISSWKNGPLVYLPASTQD